MRSSPVGCPLEESASAHVATILLHASVTTLDDLCQKWDAFPADMSKTEDT